MLTSLVTKQVDVPGEQGEWIKVRMLSGKQLEDARTVKLAAIFEMAKSMGEELRTAIANREDAPADDDDPLAAYDVDVVLRHGVVAWSYKDENGRPARLPGSLVELDEQTRTWAAKEIVALTVETEAARKGN